MDHVWTVLIMLALVVGISMVLSFFQEKNLAITYIEMRRKNLIAIGKYKRLLNSGAIVMCGVTESGCIQDARILSGVTVFSRFRPIKDLVGMNVLHLNKMDLSPYPKSVRRAIVNASDNYLVFVTGGVPKEPAGAWARLGEKFPSKRTPKEV